MKKMSLFVMLAALAGSVMSLNAQPTPLSALLIQDRIDAAVTGEEVLVPAGIYEGTLTLKDGVILRGAGDAVTILDGQGAAEVVTFGKESALIGFTVRNGRVLAANKGSFIGIFECTLEAFSHVAVYFENGAGVVAQTIITGNDRTTTGIFSAGANPLIINNVIANNRVGVHVLPHLIPSIVGNLFQSNSIAIDGPASALAVIERNRFSDNGEDSRLGPLPASNEVGPVEAHAFVLQRGLATSAYHDLMMETYHAAVKDHPIIVYDLQPQVAHFDAIGLFPWANFVLAASAVDTRIERYEAYDVVGNRALSAEYMEQPGDGRPSVRVHNPELLEKMRERYVLENRYVHAPSYLDEPDGRRIFRRMTNVSQIEVVIPAGYQAVSSTPASIEQNHGGRSYLVMEDVGITHIEVIMERIAQP